MNTLHKKRPGLYNNIENVILHQDNVPSYSAARIQLEIDVPIQQFNRSLDSSVMCKKASQVYRTHLRIL